MIADTIMVIMPLTADRWSKTRWHGHSSHSTAGRGRISATRSGAMQPAGWPTPVCGGTRHPDPVRAGLVGGKSSPRRRMVPHRRRGSNFFLAISPVRQGMAGAPVLRGAREEVLT